MPGAGPAAIAVSLPNDLSYCWDAGSCRLRYAWQGEFLDPDGYFNKKAEKRSGRLRGGVHRRGGSELHRGDPDTARRELFMVDMPRSLSDASGRSRRIAGIRAGLWLYQGIDRRGERRGSSINDELRI